MQGAAPPRPVWHADIHCRSITIYSPIPLQSELQCNIILGTRLNQACQIYLIQTMAPNPPPIMNQQSRVAGSKHLSDLIINCNVAQILSLSRFCTALIIKKNQHESVVLCQTHCRHVVQLDSVSLFCMKLRVLSTATSLNPRIREFFFIIAPRKHLKLSTSKTVLARARARAYTHTHTP